MSNKQFKHDCPPENAQQYWNWINERGGIAIWRSVNLSNPGASWSSPAKDKDGLAYKQPSWQTAKQPEHIITNPDEVGVYEAELYKAFPVGLRRSGFGTKLTDAAQRKLDKAMDACRLIHGDAFYKKGVLPDANASMGVYYTKSIISLREWIEKNGAGDPVKWE